MDVAMVTN